MDVRQVAAAIANGTNVRPSQGGYMVVCPAHEDHTPSLSVREGETQGVVLHCHAGCRTEDVLAASSLSWEDISRPRDPSVQTDASAVYDYHNPLGVMTYQVVRMPGKRFMGRQPGPDGQWVWNLRGVERVLYRLPEVLQAVEHGEPVWITEGEKDADYVTEQGVCGTTMPGGVNKWSPTYSACLQGADVTVWSDADEVGRKHARAVRESVLEAGAARCRVVESKYGKDAADHLGHGLTLDDVMITVPYEPEDPYGTLMQLTEFIEQHMERRPWLIKHVMRAGERVIFTGYEGFGKSALMKQFALCVALGLNPFTQGETGEGPRRVVFIDCENPADDMVEDFRRLRDAAGRYWRDDVEFFVKNYPPMNLAAIPEAAWLAEQCRAHQPDLLAIGPLYNLMNGDTAKEVEVARLLKVLALVQHEVGCAVALEHHAPHAVEGEERTVRPIGSSILRRWPSYGYGLVPTNHEAPYDHPFEFQAWRGKRRRERQWPQYLTPAGYEDPPGHQRGWYWREIENVHDSRDEKPVKKRRFG